MTPKRKTAADQLSRLAREAAEAQPRRPSLPAASGDERLEALLRNVGRIVMLPLAEISLRENVRKYVPTDTPEFAQLVDSVRRDGVLQNLIAELKVEDDGTWRLELVSGQRRYLAAERAGVRLCPVRIVQYSDRGSRVAHGLAENLLRDDLHCLDQAEGYAELLREGWTEAEIAETFDRRRQTVMQHLRLARYPEEAKRVIRQHPEKFSSFDLLNKFVAHRWLDTATLVAALTAHVKGRERKSSVPKTDPALRQAVRDLAKQSGYRMSVTGTGEAGQVTIRWASREERVALFKLLEKLPRAKGRVGKQ